jgi:hypothetical protein
MERSKIGLEFYQHPEGEGNFGDEISFIVTKYLMDEDSYELVEHTALSDFNLLCVGSILNSPLPTAHVFGSGLMNCSPFVGERTFHAVRGPLTRQILTNHGYKDVPEIYGDPALFLPEFYSPLKKPELATLVGIIPHHSQIEAFHQMNKIEKEFHIIDPTQNWKTVVDELTSCKAILSSSLHGLVISDAYSIPNAFIAPPMWICGSCINTRYDVTDLELNRFERPSCGCGWHYTYYETFTLPQHDGMLKFKDYFASQNREFHYITRLSEFEESLLYGEGNILNLRKLKKSFPFS